ncbi:MAG: hypothetical protein NT135_01395 [Candidatus Berkelbacteria bacterium]|nr:hypothetical protein [Candidatus Berkelbacteria bacterium]
MKKINKNKLVLSALAFGCITLSILYYLQIENNKSLDKSNSSLQSDLNDAQYDYTNCTGGYESLVKNVKDDLAYPQEFLNNPDGLGKDETIYRSLGWVNEAYDILNEGPPSSCN